MKVVLTLLFASTLAFSSGASVAQDKAEPTKEETKKAEAKKVDKADPKKHDGKKKVKKGGC